MADQLTLGYEALKSVFLDAAEEVQSAVNKRFGTPVSLAAGSDRVVAQRQAAQAAGDIASREAGVGAVEGMRGRPTDVDFRAPTERARTVADAARPTTADASVSQRFQAGRPTTPGEPLQRARQAARIADPEFARPTEPFTPGTQQARLSEVRPTTIDRTPFAERATVQGESALARGGTPTTVDRTPFAERATVQGESALARQGTPTAADPLSPAERAFESSPRTSSFATTADDSASLLGRAKGVARKVGEVASAGFRSPVARGFANPLTALATGAMEVEKYFDPRGKTFTDDVEMMHENINRIRSGARGSSSKPSPISYMDIRGRDDMPSNFRGTVISGGGGSDMGTKTGGESAKGRLTSTGGIAETQELIDRGLLDDNFIKDAVSDMTEQERAIMFSRNLRLGPDNFKVVYEALEGDKEPDRIQDYILYATEFEAQGARNPEDAPIIRQQSIRNVKKLVDAGVLPKKFAVSPEAPAAEMPEAPAAAEMPEAPAAEAPKAPATDARGSNLLAMGSRGAGVQKIQEDLTALNQFENLLSGKMPEAQGPFDPGVSGVDGVFGQDTQAAVKAFQKRAGIAEDGIVGPETRDALKKALDASKSAVKLQRSQAEEIKSMPSPAEPPAFGAGLQRVDEGPLEAAASEFEDITEIEPVKSDRDAPIQNTQAYEDLELDEEPRRTAFPMARDFRRRRNRR